MPSVAASDAAKVLVTFDIVSNSTQNRLYVNILELRNEGPLAAGVLHLSIVTDRSSIMNIAPNERCIPDQRG